MLNSKADYWCILFLDKHHNKPDDKWFYTICKQSDACLETELFPDGPNDETLAGFWENTADTGLWHAGGLYYLELRPRSSSGPDLDGEISVWVEVMKVHCLRTYGVGDAAGSPLVWRREGA